MSNDSEKTQTDLEWEARILCPDESCIGVIGPDGRCLECGRLYDGDLPGELPAAAASPPEGTDAAAAAAEDDPLPDDTAQAPAEASQSLDDEWAARRLCPDESCIGVIGPDGRCLECGRKAKDG